MEKEEVGEIMNKINLAYCNECEDLVEFAEKEEVIEERYKGELVLECMRVLEKDGLLVFKWNEDQIRFSEILKVFGQKPLLGDQRGKTRWVIFLK